MTTPHWDTHSNGATLNSWGGWTVDLTDEGAMSCSPHAGSAPGPTGSLHSQAHVEADAVTVNIHHPKAGIVSTHVPWDVLGALVAAMDPTDRAEVLAQMIGAELPEPARYVRPMSDDIIEAG